MSPGNPFILESKGQGHELKKQCRRGSLWVLALIESVVNVVNNKLNVWIHLNEMLKN